MATDSRGYETFRENVRKLMEMRGVTQMDLSALCGITQSDISKLLSGRREPRISTAQRVADALQTELQCLFDPAFEVEEAKLSA